MKTPADFAARREALSRQITFQRTELSQAYGKLAQPIRYGEMALQGFGFIRRYPWIFAAAPGVINLVSTGVGFLSARRGKPFKGALRRGATRPLARRVEGVAEGKPKGMSLWVGRGLKLFKVIRFIRRFL